MNYKIIFNRKEIKSLLRNPIPTAVIIHKKGGFTNRTLIYVPDFPCHHNELPHSIIIHSSCYEALGNLKETVSFVKSL